MTTEQTNVMVFKDGAGEYYLLPQATLERGWVPAERREELEQVLAGADDVFGHHPAIFVGVGLILLGGVVAAGGLLEEPTAADVKNSWFGKYL